MQILHQFVGRLPAHDGGEARLDAIRNSVLYADATEADGTPASGGGPVQSQGDWAHTPRAGFFLPGAVTGAGPKGDAPVTGAGDSVSAGRRA